MSVYHTEQRRTLVEFMARNSDTPLTIEQVMQRMEQDPQLEAVPGKSTVYRLMTRLVEEGAVKRFVRGHSRQFLYQLVGGAHCRSHLHLKCTQCGRLFHMDDDATRDILQEVLASSDFAVDQAETTLFGCCKECKNKKAGAE